MHMLWTCHLYCCYLYMCMSSTYYLGHICIMCTLSEVVLDIFLPNRQYQCHPYIISSTLYIFYHGEYVYLHPFWMTCHPHPFQMMCHLHPFQIDMSSALQRNMSYVFEVWEASNRSTRQLVWFILTFWLISLVSLTFWVFEFLGLESTCNGRRR